MTVPRGACVSQAPHVSCKHLEAEKSILGGESGQLPLSMQMMSLITSWFPE